MPKKKNGTWKSSQHVQTSLVKAASVGKRHLTEKPQWVSSHGLWPKRESASGKQDGGTSLEKGSGSWSRKRKQKKYARTRGAVDVKLTGTRKRMDI